MHFNSQDYPVISAACKKREEIEFTADKADTVFAAGAPAPSTWTAYPPAMLPPQGYAEVFVHSGNDARGALTRLELMVYLDGGRILYKESGASQVGLKIRWPTGADNGGGSTP